MNEKNIVPILGKALDIIEYINDSTEPVTLPELQHNLGISQPSCYRIVSTLVLNDWLERCVGNRYDISCKLARITAKNSFRLERYKKLQPAMNQLVRQVGHQAKLSIRDDEDFVNVCSAKKLSEHLTFSEPGFRTSIWHIVTVSTIFLTEDFTASQIEHKLNELELSHFKELQQEYKSHGYCFFSGAISSNSETSLDTLSVPIKRGERLLGVVSLLNLPGLLKADLERVVPLLAEPIKMLADLL